MRAFTPRDASLLTSRSASGRVLYAASWMVQIPRGADSRGAGSGFGAIGMTAFVVLVPSFGPEADGRITGALPTVDGGAVALLVEGAQVLTL